MGKKGKRSKQKDAKKEADKIIKESDKLLGLAENDVDKALYSKAVNQYREAIRLLDSKKELMVYTGGLQSWACFLLMTLEYRRRNYKAAINCYNLVMAGSRHMNSQFKDLISPYYQMIMLRLSSQECQLSDFIHFLSQEDNTAKVFYGEAVLAFRAHKMYDSAIKLEMACGSFHCSAFEIKISLALTYLEQYRLEFHQRSEMREKDFATMRSLITSIQTEYPIKDHGSFEYLLVVAQWYYLVHTLIGNKEDKEESIDAMKSMIEACLKFASPLLPYSRLGEDKCYTCGQAATPTEVQYRFHDKLLKAPRVTTYRRKKEYKSYSCEELDPLYRFTFRKIPKEQNLFRRWFVDDNQDAKDGNLFEAIVACHALPHESCYNCKGRNVLRWNGGDGSSWQDIVCVSCKCVYEVKTKANIEKVDEALRRNKISGGSFSRWCKLKNVTQMNKKSFLLFYHESYSKKVFPVQIAEISYVLPSIWPGTFNRLRSLVTLKSTISVKPNTRAKWFDIPLKGETIYMEEIAERLFIERFSKQVYDEFSDEYFLPDSSDEVSCRKGSDSDPSVDVPHLKSKSKDDEHLEEALRALEIEEAPDDWEDLLQD
ncbi:hypothetical protein CTEN210_12460 [Chaetoceros tenuissimus]|uniref:Uncharacterized protein n=1 Tax=Chaetoceros tenuissimus TaxID=426638 RepID=A0AAD3HAH9_9STRA|nr:hypothetical protein CTEN210_12460 [Chaetoceros tenuissimus]